MAFVLAQDRRHRMARAKLLPQSCGDSSLILFVERRTGGP